MDDATPGPQRMRYSFESRCRAVAAMVGGMSPGAAAQAVGASRATGYRWWRRYVTAGWAGLQERPSTPKHQPRRLDAAAEGEILAARTRLHSARDGLNKSGGGAAAPMLVGNRRRVRTRDAATAIIRRCGVRRAEAPDATGAVSAAAWTA